jgi:DNA-binding response OmpR family regulator
MLVDDEMELVSLFEAFLEREGHDVISFPNPMLALEYFKETSTNHTLLITDLRMPGLCGIDLACSIRKLSKDIKIFLMTAFDIKDIEFSPTYNEAKIDKLLQKPIHFSELRNLIRSL